MAGQTVYAQWQRRGAAGVMATAIAFGFQDSLEDRAGTAAIIREVEDAFGPEEAIELHLDWPPQEAWAVIRPWLLSY